MLLSLLSKVDALFIGGAMAFTFFKQQHIPIGDSPCEEDQLDAVAHVLKVAKETGKQIYLPKDLIIANAFQNDAERKTIPIQQGIPEGWQGLDIGPETIAEWKTHLTHAATVFWNGPVGAFEMSHFAHGTQEIAKTLAHLKAVTIVGGGDSVLAINQLKLASHFTHVSTGGGASLEYIEFGHLPGIDALEN
jgi:phosphoglycerate kinase